MSEARPTSIAGVLVLGLVFHLVFINSVFDCYFTSHVVHGMRRFRTQSAEAKRLVLIVGQPRAVLACTCLRSDACHTGDGLRADLLFDRHAFADVVPGAPEFVAPHLRAIAQHRGAFGVSHTRVPTESRPGHVAIIGTLPRIASPTA
jgi:GPI ethanolamine phosphate transferase 1